MTSAVQAAEQLCGISERARLEHTPRARPGVGPRMAAILAAIDAKFAYAEFISRRPPVYDLRLGESRVDQICVSGGIACDTWTTESAVELPRGRFSDHGAVFADLLVPVPPLWAGRCDEIESRTRRLLDQISRLERQRDLLEGQVGSRQIRRSKRESRKKGPNR